MKIFAVYARLKLVNEPKWLGEIAKSTGFEYDFHITFKQACFIEEKNIDEVKKITTDFFENLKVPNHRIDIVFDKIYPDPDYECIMIETKENQKLKVLQKKIVSVLKDYKKYRKPETEEYEKNFRPHLTLAMDLNKDSYHMTIDKIPSDFRITGEIKEVVLAIVKENTPKEANNPNNLTTFHL